MTIYHVPHNLKKIDHPSWDLDDETLIRFNQIENYESSITSIKDKSKYLKDLSIDHILEFFNSLAIEWLNNPESKFLKYFSSMGASFLINFIKRSNLEPLLSESLNNNINYIDNFIYVENLQRKIMAHPKGLITHWLAGNVPVLGMISLIQGIVTKNTNVIKIPREGGLILPFMAGLIAEHSHDTGKCIVNGSDIINSCQFVYCDRKDVVAQKTLSINSDIRVAWGGREAVESVMSLPRKYGTEDVIFGPKYSFAVIGKDSFQKEQLNEIAYKLAIDVSVFEQQGCNSPHTVFYESGGNINSLQFSKALAEAMEKVLKRIPKNLVSAEEASNVVNIRAEYSFTGSVFSSKGTEWTVIFSEDKGFAEACYSRTIFVRPIKNVNEVLECIEHKKHQTIGLCLNDNVKELFAKEATSKGIERITELGKMSIYDYPWDGMFPMNRFIRWASLNSNNDKSTT